MTASASTLSTSLELTAATGEVSNRAFDLAYEMTSGDLMAAWTNAADTGFWWSKKAAGGTSWTAAVRQTIQGDAIDAHFVDMGSEPGSNRIAIGIMELDTIELLGCATWDGAAWQDDAEVEPQTRNVTGTGTGDFPCAVAWVGTLGQAVCMYADDNTGNIDWASWNGTSWSLRTDVPISGKGFTDSVLAMTFNGQNELMAILSDDGSEVYAATYDGTTWTITNGGSPLESSLSSITSVPFSFVLK